MPAQSLDEYRRSTAPRRSVAWVFYAVVALLGVLAAPGTGGASLLLTFVAGAYSWYLWRGGRFVLWFW